MIHKILYLLLAFVLVALIVSIHRGNDLEHQLRALNEQAGQVSLADQDRCAKGAEAFFQNYAWRGHGDGAAYDNHYNPKLRKCFVSITILGFNGHPTGRYQEIWNAFESKKYGTYAKDRPEDVMTPPQTCRVTKSDGSDVSCQSESEFRQLAAEYMGGE